MDEEEPLEQKAGLVNELLIGVSPAPMAAVRVPTTASYARDLTDADIAALSVLPRGGSPLKPLERLRSSHHALAKCLATGMRPNQAALVTGYSVDRIRSLDRDPTFGQLVAEYRQEMGDTMADLAIRMRGVSLDALEELHDRLLSKPEEFSTGMLLDVVKAMADRTGYGTNSTMNVNLNLPTIDRPKQENMEDFLERRRREIDAPLARLEPPTRTTN